MNEYLKILAQEVLGEVSTTSERTSDGTRYSNHYLSSRGLEVLKACLEDRVDIHECYFAQRNKVIQIAKEIQKESDKRPHPLIDDYYREREVLRTMFKIQPLRKSNETP